jgi:hypothetical protein
MDRSQACIRVDQLLDWKVDAARNGKCPLCRAVALTTGAVDGSVSSTRQAAFAHRAECQLADADVRIVELCRRYAIRCEKFSEMVDVAGKSTRIEMVHVSGTPRGPRGRTDRTLARLPAQRRQGGPSAAAYVF